MATAASNNIKYLLATKAIDFANDSFKIALMQSGFVFDPDTHDEYADLSANELATANGYTKGAKALANLAVTSNLTEDRTDVTCDDVAWTASGGSIGPTPGAAIWDDTVAGDPIVGYIDFGGDQTQEDGGTLTIANIEIRIA